MRFIWAVLYDIVAYGFFQLALFTLIYMYKRNATNFSFLTISIAFIIVGAIIDVGLMLTGYSLEMVGLSRTGMVILYVQAIVLTFWKI
jgi:hypothetical protein